MYAVTSGLGSHIHHQIPHAAGCRAGYLAVFHDAHCHGIHQGIALVGIFKVYLSTHGGNAKAIAIIRYPMHRLAKQIAHLVFIRIAKTQGIESSYGACSHRKDIS